MRRGTSRRRRLSSSAQQRLYLGRWSRLGAYLRSVDDPRLEGERAAANLVHRPDLADADRPSVDEQGALRNVLHHRLAVLEVQHRVLSLDRRVLQTQVGPERGSHAVRADGKELGPQEQSIPEDYHLKDRLLSAQRMLLNR